MPLRGSLWLLFLLPCALLGAERPRSDRYGDPLPEHALARMGTARLRVDHTVEAMAFWPDDRTLAACCYDGSVRFWERATGRELRRLQAPLGAVRFAAFIPGTKALALMGGKAPVLFGDWGDFLLWDTAAAKAVWSTSVPDVVLGGCLAASPDGKLLALPETAKRISLYDVASGRKIRSLDEIKAETLVFSPDSALLAIGSDKPNSRVHLWDVRTGKKLRALPRPDFDYDSGPGAIAFSRDGKRIAVAYSSRIIVSDFATGEEKARFICPNFSPSNKGGLFFTADGKMIVPGHDPGEIRCWDPATGKERYVQKLHRKQHTWPVLSRDGKVMAVADQRWGSSRFIRLLDPATGKDVGPSADGHEFAVDFLAFSADGKTLVSGDREMVREWKTDTGEPGRLFRRRYVSDEAAVFSADRKLLALPSPERVYLWEIGRDKPMRSLEYKGKDAIQAVAFSPDGKYLLSAHNHCETRPRGENKKEGQDSLHFWDLATGKEIRSSPTPMKDLYSQLVITPDGRTAIAGSEKGMVIRSPYRTFPSTDAYGEGAGQLYLWDPRSGRQIRTLDGHRGAIRSLALSGDGRLLASASADHTVRLWELISGKTLFVLPTEKVYYHYPVTALSPDGWLVAIGTKSTLRLYSTATGKPVLELRGHNSEVRCLAFAPDNRRLASGLSDGTGLVWDVSAAGRAVQPAARRLNAKEREALWSGLADTDALHAQRAIGTLIVGGNDAIEMLKGRLRPAERVEPKRLQKLLADLDADEFAVRETATRELTNLGERAEAALSAALKNRPSLEVRKRIEDLLLRARSRELSPERLREMRAVRVLEQIGTNAARETLQSLAAGPADAWLTQEVTISLARLTQRSTQTEPRP
jgi:WD40 repeat protein